VRAGPVRGSCINIFAAAVLNRTGLGIGESVGWLYGGEAASGQQGRAGAAASWSILRSKTLRFTPNRYRCRHSFTFLLTASAALLAGGPAELRWKKWLRGRDLTFVVIYLQAFGSFVNQMRDGKSCAGCCSLVGERLTPPDNRSRSFLGRELNGATAEHPS
jgi:hypothetical protein